MACRPRAIPCGRCSERARDGDSQNCARRRGTPIPVITRGIRRAAGVHLGLLEIHQPQPDRCPQVPSVQITQSSPTVAVVTAVRNQSSYIARAVASVLAQDYPRLDYVVKDGDSSDGTLEWLGEHAKESFRLLKGPDAGQSAALNQAFAEANGEIMTFLNGDDVLRRGAVAYAASYFMQHPEVDVIYGHRQIIDPHDLEVGRWWLPAHDNGVVRHRDYIPQEGSFWRRRIWDRVGGIDSSFQFAFDWDLFLRFSEAGARFVRVPEFLAAFRTHPEQKTRTHMETLGRKEVDRLLRRVHGRVLSPWQRNLAVCHYVAASAVLTWRHRLRGT
jgi:glycosyltransferase involved in cell wall biosynthesis